MGSCYSSKASKMPLQGDKKKLNYSSGQSRLAVPKGRGGFTAFGFYHRQNGEKNTETKSVTSDVPAMSISKDALKKNENATKVPRSSPKSKFGFKKSTTNSSSGLKGDSIDSLTSNKSQVSSRNHQNKERTPDNADSQKTSKSHSMYSKMEKDFKMIDDTDCSEGNLPLTNTKMSDNLMSQNCEVNANIPNTPETITYESPQEKHLSATSTSDENGNNAEVQSTHSSSKSNTHVKGISSKLPSKLLRPFGKSKTFSGPHNERDLENSSKMKQSISKDRALTKESPRNSETMPVSKSAQPRSSFLKKGFFSRQKTTPHSSVTISHVKTEINDSQKIEKNLKIEVETVENITTDNKNEQVHLLSDFCDKDVPSKVISSKTNSVSDQDNDITDLAEIASTQTETSPQSYDDEQRSLDKKNNSRLVFSPDLQEKLENSYIPKGIAPIAMVDSVETTSIGSINSDDLMLDLDLDDDELGQSVSSFTKAKRTRSASKSGHGRSRSRSYEKPYDKETKNIFAKTRIEVVKNAADQSLDNVKSCIGMEYQQNQSTQHHVSSSGIERRDHWYRKRYNSQSKGGDDNESVDELQHLMDTQKPVHRYGHSLNCHKLSYVILLLTITILLK